MQLDTIQVEEWHAVGDGDYPEPGRKVDIVIWPRDMIYNVDFA